MELQMEAVSTLSDRTRANGWMQTISSDIIRYEYESLLRDNTGVRIIFDALHRSFWSALLSNDPDQALCLLGRLKTSARKHDVCDASIRDIDAKVFESISDMIILRSKTMRTKARNENRILLRAAQLQGRVVCI